MSFSAMKWAYEQKDLSPTEKLVLMSLANYANHNDQAWPGFGLIARDVNVAKKTVSRTIKKLAEYNLINVQERQTEYGDQDTNLYTLLLDSENKKANKNQAEEAEQEQETPTNNEEQQQNPIDNLSPGDDKEEQKGEDKLSLGENLKSPGVGTQSPGGGDSMSPKPINKPIKQPSGQLDPKVKFSMFLDWQPDKKTFDVFSRKAGIDPDSITDLEKLEFNRYWSGEHVEHTQMTWENKLISSIKFTRSKNNSNENFEPIDSESLEKREQRSKFSELQFEERQVLQEIQHVKNMIKIVPNELGAQSLNLQLTELNNKLDVIRHHLEYLKFNKAC